MSQRITWTEDDPVPVQVAAELMTYIADRPVSPGRELLQPFRAPSGWWADLHQSVAKLATHTPSRRSGHHTAARYAKLLRAFYGGNAAAGPVPGWSTEHLDLHWNNITAPQLWIIDWELWGTAVTGYGIASLYCLSLQVPEVASQLRDTFAELLDSPAGRYAQLVACAELLTQATMYDEMAGLVEPMHHVAAQLLAR